MGNLMKWIIPVIILAGIIKYRYKILNIAFGSYWIRKIAVRIAMGIPGLSSRFIQSTFR